MDFARSNKVGVIALSAEVPAAIAGITNHTINAIADKAVKDTELITTALAILLAESRTLARSAAAFSPSLVITPLVKLFAMYIIAIARPTNTGVNTIKAPVPSTIAGIKSQVTNAIAPNT